MRTDADHLACIRDPAIELLLSHTATLTDKMMQPPADPSVNTAVGPMSSRSGDRLYP